MRRRIMVMSMATLLVAALAACDANGGETLSPEDAVPANEVSVVDNRFEPGVIEVSPGDTVTWTWDGSAPHDVDGDGFVSAIQRTGTFQRTFEEAGEYRYVCNVHNGMNGLVVVTGG